MGYGINSFNFEYSYLCEKCNSELEFKSMNMPPDKVMCACGEYMLNIRIWAKSYEIYKNGWSEAQK